MGTLAKNILSTENVLDKVLKYCTAQDEFALACTNKMNHQASIDRRKWIIQKLTGLSGADRRARIEAYDDERRKNGKRAWSNPSGTLHPAIRAIVKEMSAHDIAEQFYRHLKKYVSRLLKAGGILMSGHSHFVALWHAAEQMGLRSVLNMHTNAFFKRIWAFYIVHSNRKTIKYDDALCSTILLGRMLTYSGGMDEGWDQFMKFRYFHARTCVLSIHGEYYDSLMKSTIARPKYIWDSDRMVPTQQLMFRNFHFKPGGRFHHIIRITKSRYAYHYTESALSTIMDQIATFPHVTSEELTIILADFSTVCDINKFDKFLSKIRRLHPDLEFTESQLCKIAHMEWSDPIFTGVIPLSSTDLGRICMMISTFDWQNQDIIGRKLDVLDIDRLVGSTEAVFQSPCINTMVTFASTHAPIFMSKMQEWSIKALKLDGTIRQLECSIVNKWIDNFHEIGQRNRRSIFFHAGRQLRGNVEISIFVERFTPIALDVISILNQLDMSDSIFLRKLTKKRTSDAWKNADVDCISIWAVPVLELHTIAYNFMTHIILPQLHSNKRALIRGGEADADDEADDARYAKRAKLA